MDAGRFSTWLEQLSGGLDQLSAWMEGWESFDSTVSFDGEDVAATLENLVSRLHNNLPYFHPRYAGHMLKPPHPAASLAYTLTMLVNPNNQTREVGAATTDMELEVIEALASMLELPADHVGHLTSNGTIANLEALWVARELRPDGAIAFSEAAHYNHRRITDMLDVETVELPTGADETIDPDALPRILESERVGTIVATAGTTGFGSVDPIHRITSIAEDFDVRVHVDAAYGGFFKLLSRRDPPLVAPEPFEALSRADSITLDPHTHGLQPYGSGCIIHRHPSVLRHYDHVSPYTYLQEDGLNLGKIQFECSRPGAAAAALWATLQLVPLQAEDGLGEILAAARRSARMWYLALDKSHCLKPVVRPHTDVVSFVPWPDSLDSVSASELSEWTDALFRRAGRRPEEPVYVTTYDVPVDKLSLVDGTIRADQSTVTVIRACCMKPEHEDWWPELHIALEDVAWEILRSHCRPNFAPAAQWPSLPSDESS